MAATRSKQRAGSRRSGSALVFVLVLTIAMASIIVSMVAMAGQQYTAETHDEQTMRAQYALEGALTNLRYSLNGSVTTFPYSASFTVGSFTVTTTSTDNSGVTPDSLSVAESCSRWNRTFRATRTIGNPSSIHDPSWWNFAAAMNSTSTFQDHLTTHGANDDVYANSTFTVGANSTIQNDLYTISITQPASVTVKGTFFGGTAPKTWIRPRNPLYAANATTTLSGDQTFNNYNFGTDYSLVYINGDLHYHNKITKKGTFYVTGDIYITDNTTYNGAADKVVFITPNTIHFTKNGTTQIGYYYAGTAISIEGDTTLNKGGMVAKQFTSGSGDKLDITWDNWASANSALATQMFFPGFWP